MQATPQTPVSQTPIENILDQEVALRKRLGRSPDDISLWFSLIRVLLRQGNYFEVRSMCKALLARHPDSFDASRVALVALFKAGFLAMAYDVVLKLAPDFSKLDADERESIAEICLLFRSRPDCPVRHPAELGIRREFDEFNWKADRQASRTDAVCLLVRPFHHAIQKRIAVELEQRGIGTIFTQHVETAIAASPKVIIVSEALNSNLERVRSALPDCRLINTRHGLGDKNHAALGASQSDYICVSSPFVSTLFSRDYVVPEEKILVTGFPLMDELFQSQQAPRLPAAQDAVLFAPTYNAGLGAGHLLVSNPVESIRGSNEDLAVHIRPHPRFIRDYPDIIAGWVDRHRGDRNVYFYLSEWTNIVDLFNRSAIMVSDVSSAGLAWLATGKPLVCLVDRAASENSPRYAPEGIEWAVHEAADVVSDPAMLRETIRIALKSPDRNSAKRALWRDRLFGAFQDGLASARIADKVAGLLREQGS